MSAVLTERLVAVALAARSAGHGGKGAIYDAACRDLNLSRATLLRKLKEVAVMTPRKRRSDAGQTALSRDEAMLISAVLMESTRKNGKRLYAVADAVATLRSNDMIRAMGIDTATGELRPLSESTISRALRGYGLHPDQLLAPAPVTELASRHPNHVWQVDASMCVLYYLRPSADARANGLRVMDAEVFYKNKPGNLTRIANERVWRYAITDHSSGWVYVEYVTGGESGENLCSVLINAMQERGGADVLHGRPTLLMMDPGSANTAAMTRNLCRALGIQMVVNKVGNARAKGQVENSNNLIECKLEPGLKFQPVHDLNSLNVLARKWRSHFNATALHSRHGCTRTALWMTISASQLIKVPAIAVCRELAIAEPESRKVSPRMTVSFHGVEYDVSRVPEVMVGEKLMVTRNPWRDQAAQVVLVGADGRECFHVVDAIQRDEYGFRADAAVIGESFKPLAHTPAQVALGRIEQLVTGTDSVTAAESARKTRALPFGGRLDPYKPLVDADLPIFIPRRGTAHELIAPIVELPMLTHFEAAKLLKPRVEANGGSWSAAQLKWLQQRYPEGIPQDAFSAIVAELTGQSAVQNPPLRLLKTA